MEKLHFTLFDLWDGEENIKASKDYAPFQCETEIKTDVSAVAKL